MPGRIEADEPVTIIHATAIALAGRGALLRGRPGSGKSDLALRCIALPAGPLWHAVPMLVADDRVVLTRSGETLLAGPPDAIRGKIEVRGIGIVAVPIVAECRIAIVVDLDCGIGDRMPDPPETCEVMDVRLPRLRLAPFEASAPHKLLIALANAGTDT